MRFSKLTVVCARLRRGSADQFLEILPPAHPQYVYIAKSQRPSPTKSPVSFLDLGRLIPIEFGEMVRKCTFMVLAVAAILLLQFADCMSAMTVDQESMQCCGSMPCEPSNQHHDCCKSMVSSHSRSVLPATHSSLHAPVMFVADVLPSPLIPQPSEAARTVLAAPQHSPPELYTLHSSFLI